MKKYLIMALFCLLLTPSLFALGRHSDNNDSHKSYSKTTNHLERRHHGGSGVPEPASILLILAGGAAAFGIKKIIKK